MIETPGGERNRAEPQARRPSTGQLPSVSHRLLSGGAWALSGMLLSMASGLALYALLARLLSPEEMGAYFLAFSVVTVAGVVARMGLDRISVRFIAESLGTGQQLRAKGVVTRAFALSVVGTTLVAGAIWLGLGRWLALHVFGSTAMAGVSALVAAWTVAVSLQIMFEETFRGFHDIRLAALSGRAASRVLAVVLLAAVWFTVGHIRLRAAVALSVACVGASILFCFWMLTRKLRDLKGGEAAPIPVATMLRTSWPLMMTTLESFVLMQSGLWIIGAFRPEDETALYAAPARLVIMVGMLLNIFNAVLPPVIAELNVQGRKKELEKVLRSTATLAAMPAAVFLVAFLVFARPILDILFGAYYTSGASVLRLLSVAQLFNVMVGSCGYTLLMTGHQKATMGITLVSCSIAVLGGLAVVEPFGLEGVAAVSAVAVIVQQVLMLAFARWRCGVWTHGSPLLIKKALRMVRFH